MKRFILAALLACTNATALANTQIRIEAGPARVKLLSDRYSSQASIEVSYRGYLVQCDPLTGYHAPIVALLIFHRDGETAIHRMPMYISCTPSFYTREFNVALVTRDESDPAETDLWLDIGRFRRGTAIFELAFEKDGAWDSNYGANFPVRL